MEELKDRYEIIEEAASDAIVTIDEHGRILSISRAAERIFRIYRSGDDGTIVGPRHSRLQTARRAGRRRGKNAPVIEVTGIHKTGKAVQIELSLGEYNKNNRHIYTAVIRDIGARKYTDRRLAAQFAVTRALAESSACPRPRRSCSSTSARP